MCVCIGEFHDGHEVMIIDPAEMQGWTAGARSPREASIPAGNRCRWGEVRAWWAPLHDDGDSHETVGRVRAGAKLHISDAASTVYPTYGRGLAHRRMTGWLPRCHRATARNAGGLRVRSSARAGKVASGLGKKRKGILCLSRPIERARLLLDRFDRLDWTQQQLATLLWLHVQMLILFCFEAVPSSWLDHELAAGLAHANWKLVQDIRFSEYSLIMVSRHSKLALLLAWDFFFPFYPIMCEKIQGSW
jgi:hypothetical protein